MSRPVDLSMSSVKNHSPLNPGGSGGFTPVFEASPAVSPASSRRPSISQPVARRPSESASASRRPSMNQYYSSSQQIPQQISQPQQALSRRSSMASGPRPIRRGEYSGPATPSVLSRAGSPTLPLGNEFTQAPRSYFEGAAGYTPLGGVRELRNGQFIGSLDCGTTSTRFIIFDKRAKIVAEHQTEFEQILPHAGWHEHDPEALVEAMNECIIRAVEKLEWMGWSRNSLKGIGITNQRETTVCWSRSTGKPLANAIVWDDARTVGVVREMEKKLDEIGIRIETAEEDAKTADTAVTEEVILGTGGEDAAFGDKGEVVDQAAGVTGSIGKALEGLGIGKDEKEPVAKGTKYRKGKEGLVDVTGIPMSTYFSAIKLRWMIDHQKAVRTAHETDDLMFGTVDTWLVYNLTGGKQGGLHIMDVTNASRTLLISLKTLQWHHPLLEFFGLRASILPKIVSSSEHYGNIHESTNLPIAGVPIAGIIGDQQAALVGNKCLRKGEAKCTYGTGAFVLFNTGEEIVRSNYGLISTVAFQPGPDAKPVYALEGSIAVAGSAIKWLRDQMDLIEDSSEMDILAGSVPDTGGVYFVTAFSGLLAPYWDREASGTVIGISAYTTSAHIARATLESVCFQTRAVLDVIEKESDSKLTTLKVDGGVTNSDLAMQLQANLGGFNVARPSMRESTALGSALLAASALGLFGWDLSRPETLSEVNTAGVHTFEPELPEKSRLKRVKGWNRAVSRASKWHEEDSEDEDEEEYEKSMGFERINN
ncbi:glycerol kinase [Cryptococcus amylolentus CBS 6039]|uniref:glycerol kinase n=2 Tax=Cryptococcus amylolentus TaxID=104669 RepID=A0A1E3HZK5_9TREE|nr:glycerol kinase [Cryptococcus amylolentus CBS 6039]ODN81707.1 glycerol kinase [Cryptococcus amylolentus CBS 6039]ODO10091.1 glycerol kinase [Cryptococcus amylolentus CBS 6273]